MKIALIVGAIVGSLGIAYSPSIVALARDHPSKWLIVTFNVLLSPLIGFFVAATILLASPAPAAMGGEDEAEKQCATCGAGYRASDYRQDAARILCSHCGAELVRETPAAH